MDMILAHMSFENIHLKFRTNLTNQVTQTGCNRTYQKRFTKLGDPDKMQFDVKFSVRSATVIVHTPHYTGEIA